MLLSLPTRWPRRETGVGREIPIVSPLVRAATADPGGNLWASMTLPNTYVCTPSGEKSCRPAD